MAYTSGFFDGDNLYGQTEFNRYFDNIYESGVSVDGTGAMTCKVTLGTNAVTVGTGFAIIKGFWFYNDAPVTLNLTNAPSVNSRYDLIVLRLNVLTGTIEPAVVKGTAASSPVEPSLTRTDAVYEIALARVKRTPSKTTIVDKRSNEDQCGVIRPKNVSSYQTMIESMQSQFDEFMQDKIVTQTWRTVYVQSNTPTGAVTGSIWIQEL